MTEIGLSLRVVGVEGRTSVSLRAEATTKRRIARVNRQRGTARLRLRTPT